MHIATRFLGSGAEQAIAEVVDALPGPEFEHVLVVGRDHDRASITKLCGNVEVVVVSNLIRRPDPIRDPLAFVELVRVLRRYRPDLVHTIESKSGILGRAAARVNRRLRVVHTVNMANFGPGFSRVMSALYVVLERLAARWTDAFIVNGLELRDRYVRARIAPETRFTLVRSAVDLDRFREEAAKGPLAARASLELPVAAPLVLVAGSLDRRKGAHLLPEFLDQLSRLVPGIVLVVAGRGPLQADIEAGFERRGLRSSVRMLGFTDRIPEAMVAADCLVMLNSAEGLARVLLQAAAVGTPFVSFVVDGPAELLALGARGRVVPQGDLASAVNRTADMLRDGRGPLLALPEWDPSQVGRGYSSVFREALRR